MSPILNCLIVAGAVHSSVKFPDGSVPEAITIAFVVPAPESFADLAVPKSATSVQDVPSQFSVAPVAGGVPPPATKAAVLSPAPVGFDRAVFIFVISVHDEPLNDSTESCLPGADGNPDPPTANIAVVVPVPPPSYLPTFISPVSVHADPFQDSVNVR